MSEMSAEKTRFSVYAAIILLPFLLYYWMLPFVSDKTIGSDYLIYAFSQQIELFFSLKTGSFPLYVPGFSSGHPSSALTLAQIFHPLSHLASIMPGYWDGKAIEWNSFYKLLSLGITQLALFLFLKEIRLNSLLSFLLSFITVYNLRSIHLFSQAASLEAYTGYLVLCTVIGWYFIRPTRLTGPLCMIFGTYFLIVSGHPEEMYYGLAGAVLFTGIAPFYLATMLKDKAVDHKVALRFWMKTGLCISLGIMLSSVYILPFYFDFISANIFRVDQNYATAASDIDTFYGTLNNFFVPLHSYSKGAFGGSSLILVALVLPVLRLFKIKVPASIWAVWVLLLFMFLFIQGSRTPVHRLAWEYLPFASSIRVAGRFALVIPFFIMLLLAWVVKTGPVSFSPGRLLFKTTPSAVLAYVALALLIVYSLWYIAAYNIFSFVELQKYFTYPVGEIMDMHFFWVSIITIILGISTLILFARYTSHNHASVIGAALVILTLAQVAFALKYRSAQWAEEKYDSPTFQAIQKQKKITLNYPYFEDPTFQTSVVMKHLSNTFLEPYLGKIYTMVTPVGSQEEAYESMKKERLLQQVFLEGYQPEKAAAVTNEAKGMNSGTVTLAYSSFNCLKFRVSSQTPAVFGFAYPFTGYWKALVNDKETAVYRANGAAHAVEIPEGESFVEFRYWSEATFWGMLISCSVFAVIGLFICFRDLKGITRFVGIISILIISIGGFLHWHNSLYNGDNLETEYVWTYTAPRSMPNLAYGKKTRVSPVSPRCYYCGPDFSHTLLVDGDLGMAADFSAQGGVGPSWFLDLHSEENIKTILLYESGQDPLVNVRPLQIALSNDGNAWNTAASVDAPTLHEEAARITFDKPVRARYIRITSSGESQLSFSEVEVYGPNNIEQKAE